MPEPLIAVLELRRALDGERPPLLLDVRWNLGGPPGVDEYRQGHIPGARFVDLDRDLAGPPGAGRHPLPDESVFQAAMRRLGVGRRTAIVVYDAATAMSAARAWWLLRYFGHPDVRVLDGGYAAWVRAGMVTSAEAPEVEAGDFVADRGHMPMVDAGGAAALADHGVLLDARVVERFRGEQEPVDPVAGHIPGARSLPTARNVGSDGRFLSSDELRRRFTAVGADGRVEVGSYCGSGVTAAHEVLALAVVGIPASLYVGSWSDWITDPSRPVAVGPE